VSDPYRTPAPAPLKEAVKGMTMKLRICLIPILTAIFFAACRDPLSPATHALPTMERDLRSAIVGLVLASLGIVIISIARSASKEEET
jgi:hypothetical protein